MKIAIGSPAHAGDTHFGPGAAMRLADGRTLKASADRTACGAKPDAVSQCAAELGGKGVAIELPVTDQPWGHRTLFFRDPDGNVIEIYAEL